MHAIATFIIPAVIEEREWKYSSWRVVVTDRADTLLAQYLLKVVRT